MFQIARRLFKNGDRRKIVHKSKDLQTVGITSSFTVVKAKSKTKGRETASAGRGKAQAALHHRKMSLAGKRCRVERLRRMGAISKVLSVIRTKNKSLLSTSSHPKSLSLVLQTIPASFVEQQCRSAYFWGIK